MKNTVVSSNQETKSAKKRQQSANSIDIGSPRVPIKQRQTKQQQETLSDWAHAS
ncbi:hypothetical protein [Calothrix sp. PCC 6303]|uniref:hypothetical protein n=1 Tax=Calothrix sp. PCC 6303 TaxID=1170562 RepID=UPI0002A056F3|nr:hypothetical protein [Calothrix sp. PCC 6303]AFZ00207.1 hypothetical protein Cal6303_1145 [Calothrix sp. PCC 6303]